MERCDLTDFGRGATRAPSFHAGNKRSPRKGASERIALASPGSDEAEIVCHQCCPLDVGQRKRIAGREVDHGIGTHLRRTGKHRCEIGHAQRRCKLDHIGRTAPGIEIRNRVRSVAHIEDEGIETIVINSIDCCIYTNGIRKNRAGKSFDILVKIAIRLAGILQIRELRIGNEARVGRDIGGNVSSIVAV